MFERPFYCFFIMAVPFVACTQGQPSIVSYSETIGVYTGQTAVLKCHVTNLGENVLTWSFLTHDFVIYERGQILTNDKTKYSVINMLGGQIQNLQILNVEKTDHGFYKCAIEGTDQHIITHLNVLDAPRLIMSNRRNLNKTDCCLAEKVTESCLPGCYPSQIDLQTFNVTANCGTVENLKGLSKCFTGGSNHDNCCLDKGVNSLCLGFCHNDITDTLTPEHFSKCFTKDVINQMFTCFEIGFASLPSEPTEVVAMVLHDELSRAILVKWSEPKKNSAYVIGYSVLYKSRNQASYSSVLIKDPKARSFRLNGDEFEILLDMDYKIRVSALAVYGVSFGSVEVDIYVSNSTVRDKLNTDIDACCSNRSINENCRQLLCHSKTWSQFNTYHLLPCFPYLDDVFTCLVGQRNHTNCCAAFDVTSDCLPLCSGQPPPLNNSLIGCVSQMSIIEACVQQGYGTLPAPPSQLTVTAVETTSATLYFHLSSSKGVSQYLVGLRTGNEDAPFIYNITVQVSEEMVQLNDLSPNTYYWVRIVSVSEAGDSLPSETVSCLTYPEDYNDPKPEPVINVPHNLTDCCINTGMPEVCWRGCEYRSNITSYFRSVLLDCFIHIGSVLACAADGRDHSECCRTRGVQSKCVDLCAHTKKGPLDAQYVPCVPDTSQAIACFVEGIVNLPRHPDVVVSNVSKNSISLKWEQPKTSGLIDYYNISYGIIYSEKTVVSTNRKFYILQDLEPSTQYEISVTSTNSNGTSPPSPIITQFTLSDDIQVPVYNTTTIYGRALWQNISHCCENSVQKDCLRQCLNKQTASPQHTTCIMESHKMLACFADGKDHRLCCQEKGLPSTCIPICGGHALTTDVTMATCMSYTNRDTVLSCFLENKGLIPGAPQNFEAKLYGTEGSVQLQWTPSANCGADCTYTVHYWKVGEDSDVIHSYNITNNFKIVQVELDNSYTFTVTADNTYGSSAPSAWQTLFVVNYERNVHLYLDSNTKWVGKGQSAKFICEKIGFDPSESPKVEWFFNNSKLNNDNKTELLIPSVDPIKDEGVYTCTVTDSKIPSSDSVFLLIKYPPKINHFEMEKVNTGNGESTTFTCLFQGLPDSDPQGWLKDRQPLKQDMRKYTMTQDQDDETGITTYKLKVADMVEADYGLYSLAVSNAYGSAECHFNLTDSTNIIGKPTSGTPDLQKCCADNNVTPLCQELCGFHINVTEIAGDSKYLPCLKYFETYIVCGADGRDHSQCCQSKGVLPLCVPLCSGVVPADLLHTSNLLKCLSDYTDIFSCAQQGHLLLPYMPQDVTLSYRSEDNIITVHWKEPHQSEDKVDHYNIYYNYSGSPVTRNVRVDGVITEYNIMNVQPQTEYQVWMTAGNEHGNSQATSIKVIDTTSDAHIFTSEVHTEQTNNAVAIGVGVTVAIIALAAIVFLVLFFVCKSRMFPSRVNNTVTFENPGYGNQGQIKIHGADEQFSYGRLHEDRLPEGLNAHDSSSTGESAADSSFENPIYQQLQSGNSSAAATLPVESNS